MQQRFYDTEEIAERIRKFEQAAQALLDLYGPVTPQEQKNLDTPSAPSEDGETRSYYFSTGAIRQEKELLRRYQTEDFHGLLEAAHMLLVGLVKTMKNTHPDVRVKGYVVVSLGTLLEQASSLLLRMCNVYGRAEKIR